MYQWKSSDGPPVTAWMSITYDSVSMSWIVEDFSWISGGKTFNTNPHFSSGTLVNGMGNPTGTGTTVIANTATTGTGYDFVIAAFDANNNNEDGEAWWYFAAPLQPPEGHGNWVLSQSCPEPTSFVLAGIGAMGGLAYGWSRRRDRRRLRPVQPLKASE